MGYGLKDIPRSEYGQGFGVKATDLESGFLLPAGNLGQGVITPDKMGLSFVNKTGGTLTSGTLVTITGWDATSGRVMVTKAAATALALAARWIVLADVLNNGLGNLGQHLALGGQNTNAATVGDPVYLDTTAGAFKLTTPPAAPVCYQIVGFVSVKSATVGMVELRTFGQSPELLLEELLISFGTIATTGATESNPIQMDRAGAILGFRLVFLSALAASDTNFISWSVNNRTQSLLLTADNTGGRNTTKATGGTAVVQYGGYPLVVTTTPANLVVAAGDVLTVSAAVTNTLPGTLQGSFRLIHAPS